MTNRATRFWWNLLSYGIAAGCLYWVFHDISFASLLRSIARIEWWWLAPAALLSLSVYVCASWEWHLLLKPLGNLSLICATQAVFAGRFANDVLPVHAGYVIRVYLASRWLGSSIVAIIPSLLLERLFDGLWLVAGVGLLTLLVPMPAHLAHVAKVLGTVILAGAVVVAWMILRKRKVNHSNQAVFSCWWPLRRIMRFIHDIDQGIRSIGRSYVILAALGLSILKLALQAWAFLAVLNAYDFAFSFRVRLAIFMITYIGIAVPSTPAGLGVFQLFCAAGLTYFGVEKPVAGGCALVAYIVLTVPLAIAGFVAITRSGLTLRQVNDEIKRWNSRRL